MPHAIQLSGNSEDTRVCVGLDTACPCCEGKKEVAKIACTERLHFYLKLKKSVGEREVEGTHTCCMHSRCSQMALWPACAGGHSRPRPTVCSWALQHRSSAPHQSEPSLSPTSVPPGV